MFDHLLESSHRDDSNKWSNIGFGQEITELASIKVNFMHLIWSSGHVFQGRHRHREKERKQYLGMKDGKVDKENKKNADFVRLQ